MEKNFGMSLGDENGEKKLILLHTFGSGDIDGIRTVS